jgi:hypothetical protein
LFFEFTEQPSDDITLIAGDFLYNVRASLDHMAGCVVPAQRRGRAIFPIFWQVWEATVPGEDKQRTRDRQTWIDCTRDMPADVVAIIATNQPPDLGSTSIILTRSPFSTDSATPTRTRNSVSSLPACSNIEGWYGFVESPTFQWDAVPPHHAVKIRLPSGSVGDITIDNYTPGAMLVRVEGSGPGPWRAASRSARS